MNARFGRLRAVWQPRAWGWNPGWFGWSGWSRWVSRFLLGVAAGVTAHGIVAAWRWLREPALAAKPEAESKSGPA
jgi:hypothetical protein